MNLKNMSKKYNKIEFYAKENGENGYFNPNTNTLYVNTLSEEGVVYTATHEYGHSLEITNKKSTRRIC